MIGNSNIKDYCKSFKSCFLSKTEYNSQDKRFVESASRGYYYEAVSGLEFMKGVLDRYKDIEH